MRETTGLLDRCSDALGVMGEFRWFSHLTAARLWGIPIPVSYRDDEPLHVLTFAGAEPVRRPGIVGWASEDARLERRWWKELPVISAADVWCQLAVPGATGRDRDTRRASALPVDWLIAAGDYLLTGPYRDGGGRVPLCTASDLADAVRRHRGKRGAKSLAVAIDQVRTPVHSPRETQLRLCLIDRGLPEPRVQVAVETVDGIRHADLGYPEARVLIEYQGDHHRTDRGQWQRDLRRTQLFEDAGYRVILVTAADLDDGGVALAGRIRRALRR